MARKIKVALYRDEWYDDFVCLATENHDPEDIARVDPELFRKYESAKAAFILARNAIYESAGRKKN